MKKASQKAAAPVSLGTKRACPECSTKIYDFNRAELTCPKCERTFTPDEAPTSIPIAALLKRPKAQEKADGELAAQTDVLSSDETVDSADDVAVLDSDDDGVEDIAVDDEDDDEED